MQVTAHCFTWQPTDKQQENPDQSLPGKCFLSAFYITWSYLTQDKENKLNAQFIYLVLDRIDLCQSSAHIHKKQCNINSIPDPLCASGVNKENKMVFNE